MQNQITYRLSQSGKKVNRYMPMAGFLARSLFIVFPIGVLPL